MNYNTCSHCGSTKMAFAILGFYCHDCNQMSFVEEFRDNFTKSLVERYSNSPPDHNKPHSDGLIDNKGNIVPGDS